MKPPIAILGTVWPDAVLAALDQQFTCHKLTRMTGEQRAGFFRAEAAGVRGVLTTGVAGIDAALAAQFPALEIVAVHGVGLDAVALEALAARGIVVTNTPDVLTDDVADLAVSLLLAAARRIPALDRYVRAGHWADKRPLQPSRSLRGKVAGIYGYGRIGQAVAARLRGFGMEIRYFQRSDGPEPALRSPSLQALAGASDYLLVCAPGGPATCHAVDAAVLDALGPEGTLVNIARGSVVDEAALVAALASKRLGGAALDVFEDEPNVPAALTTLENVVLTPHVGSLTVEARLAMRELAIGNLLAHFAGKPLLSPVDA
ncbi:2-hydroxyacid dehydrogenase [Massilia yuzhufengensis]|uniref:Lactate dehydrogenase n=1 Tax=Massilia yuzhufengensis TaxID=1164594 RepID=A0A1I1ULN2_9BURK|nr:2-hydroxyacid dehydrogenase [Massilia yuzhufengensis]SFD71669.1 Lactate dehydrogenase [Massilia yuzhufengensis]